MNSTQPSQRPVLDALRQAGAVHARHRALRFLLRFFLWLTVALPLLMLADVLFHFEEIPRRAAAVGVALAALAGWGTAACLAWWLRPPVLRVARMLESRNPALGSKLINILQLEADAHHAQAAPLTRELARRAVADAQSAVDLPALPPLARDPRLPRHALHAVAALGLLGVLTLCGGRHVRQEWLRFLDPFGDHPPFSLTYLEILQPAADAESILYGGGCRVEVRATGHSPGELFVTARPLAGTTPTLTLPMTARGDGTFVARLENLREPVELTAHTGNGASRSRRRVLELILTPQFGPAWLRISPPAYTGAKPRKLPYRFTALQVLEGSQVEMHIGSNRPLGRGAVELENDSAAPVEIALQPAVDGPGEVAVAHFTAEESGRLTFSLIDRDGNAASESPTASLTVTRDLPPAIAFTVPEQDALVVEGLVVPLVVDASDDYGLRSLRLHIGINDKFVPLDPRNFSAPDTRRHRLEHSLDLAQLGARPGDRITLFAEAVDTRPEPQITRTATRRLEVITQDQYNDRLRETSDVAMIAGNYERLLERLEQQIQAQREVLAKLAALRGEAPAAEADGERVLTEFAEAFTDQTHLNERLEAVAEAMEQFAVRDEPVYDFEKDLHERLAKQAAAIRESVAQNRAQGEQALEKCPRPPATPTPDMIDGLHRAAREQLDRLQGGAEHAEEEIRQPLEELARLHELMKDFNRFQQLADEQRELAEQSKAYQDKAGLNAQDRLALRELGARQRDLAPKLEQLGRKLRHDAAAADPTFPEAAASARELAQQIEDAAMPGLARRAAQSMLDSKAADAHAQALNLYEAMDRLFDEAGEAGRQGVARGLDRALRLTRRMNPGDSLRQMMLSKNFRALPGEGDGGAGAGGFLATSAMDAAALLLGGESLLDGPIADAIAGRGDHGGAGASGSPSARLDRPDQAKVDETSARRTGTPEGGTLLLEYDNIADAYFRRLTTSNPTTSTTQP